MAELREPLPFDPVLADLFRLDPRFVGKVWAEAEDGCWIWTGAQTWDGASRTKAYGKIYKRGTKKGTERVHRYVYRLFWGAIPPGYDVHHTREEGCSGDGCCINPRHLEAEEAGTHRAGHEENLHRGHYATRG